MPSIFPTDLFFRGKSALNGGNQAQQSYRFILKINGVDAALIKDVTVPKYKINTTSYNMLDYKFNFPGKVEWTNPISFTVLQMIDEDSVTSALGFFMSKLNNSSYYASPMGIGDGERDAAGNILPFAAVKEYAQVAYNVRNKISDFVNNPVGYFTQQGYERLANEGTVFDLSKQKLEKALGRVEIVTMDEEGNSLDSWRLNGAFISAVTPTDLTYDSEKVSTIKIDITYDWASYGYLGVYAEEDSVLRVFGI